MLSIMLHEAVCSIDNRKELYVEKCQKDDDEIDKSDPEDKLPIINNLHNKHFDKGDYRIDWWVFVQADPCSHTSICHISMARQ